MQFDTFGYWLFFFIVLLLFASQQQRNARIVLLVASYTFYAFWDVHFLLLLGGSTLGNYYLGRLIDGCAGKRKRMFLIIAIVANLALLGFFKYCNFFIDSFSALFGLNGQSLMLNIVLPVGISFFTFEGIAYAMDIYRKDIRAERSLLNFSLFISFFPHLIAGPIIRPHDYFPQLEQSWRLTRASIQWSGYQIIKGLFKKLVLSDSVAAYANQYFAGDGSVSVWAGVIGFGLQIYFDFSGYTDMARGCARLFGIQLPINFDRPYLAHNISKFWRKWHISLSSWLRDYLFIPLGGSRVAVWKIHRNLFIVMILGGLWHGASWGFALWGLWHGLLLSIHKLSVDIAGEKLKLFFTCKPGLVIGWFTTILCVFVGWIPFRATNFEQALRVTGDFLAIWNFRTNSLPAVIFGVIGFSAIYMFVDRHKIIDKNLEQGISWNAYILSMGLVLCLIDIFMVRNVTIPFIYFQF